MMKRLGKLGCGLVVAVVMLWCAAPGRAGAAEAATPAAEAAPVPKSPTDSFDDIPSYGEALVRMVVVLVSILIVLFLLARFVPRWLGRPLTAGRGGTIRVVDSLMLEPRKRIYLLKVGEQLFLVGTSEAGVHMLADKSLDAGPLLAKLNEAAASGDAALAPGASSSTMRSFAAALSGKAPMTTMTTLSRVPAGEEGA